MATQRVTLICRPHEVVVDAVGIQGEECRNVTEKIRRAIGSKEKEDLKPDFFESKVDNQQSAGNG